MDVAVEFHSLSKTYNMTGWRVGWMAGNAEVVEALGRVKTNVDSGIFQAVQHASSLRWISSRTGSMRATPTCKTVATASCAPCAIWARRPRFPRPACTFGVPTPGGMSSVEFATRLIDEVGVIVTPGVGFGAAGEGHFRISLTTPDDRLDEALERIATVRF